MLDITKLLSYLKEKNYEVYLEMLKNENIKIIRK
jgi:ribosomal protein S15P/S13E